MTGTDLCVNKSQFVPVIFEPSCNKLLEIIPIFRIKLSPELHTKKFKTFDNIR
jgi:hypothetical protein